MKDLTVSRRILTLTAAVALTLSASALALSGGQEEDQAAYVADFSKNTVAAEVICFSAEEFQVLGSEEITLDSLMVTSLPDQDVGILTVGSLPVSNGDLISASALDTLRFYPVDSESSVASYLTFTPVFSSGSTGSSVRVSLYLLAEENAAPVAQNSEFTTYKNVAYTGQLSAVDPEGDLLSFQITDKPARGSVTLSEDGSFVYTPYENKTGKDSFSYVAIDAVGNTSEEAVVKLTIQKPSTKVSYQDMDGNSAHCAAIRLAEEGIWVGASMDGAYYFQPELTVSRSEFLALAMATVGLDALEGVTTIGFSDDEAIAVWAKSYVSSALKSGVINGIRSETGEVVFSGDRAITEAEAAVILDRLLEITDVAEAGSFDSVPTWASQAVANLTSVGILQADASGVPALQDSLNRAQTAQLLCAALDVIEARSSSSGWFS
ncbi:MAG: Ig-like domain-containing protein [Oscillospiraceae bacterium]|nr:Ig-like domain-containing protein [Oscillospiraceae bacterium]